MIQAIIFGAASVAFWLGVAADAKSSNGMHEKTAFFRDKAGIFDRRKYLLSMAALWGACLAVVLIGQDLLYAVGASAMLVFGAVVRFRIAAKNRALRAGH
jgi:hypothetical protein